jgi:hypothetical protein
VLTKEQENSEDKRSREMLRFAKQIRPVLAQEGVTEYIVRPLGVFFFAVGVHNKRLKWPRIFFSNWI